MAWEIEIWDGKKCKLKSGTVKNVNNLDRKLKLYDVTCKLKSGGDKLKLYISIYIFAVPVSIYIFTVPSFNLHFHIPDFNLHFV